MNHKLMTVFFPTHAHNLLSKIPVLLGVNMLYGGCYLSRWNYFVSQPYQNYRTMAVTITARCMIVLALFVAVLPIWDKHEPQSFAALIHHYEEHNREQNLNIWQFLWLHYSPSSHHSQSREHESLPFHSHCCTSPIQVALPAVATKSYQPIAIHNIGFCQPSHPAYHYILYASIFQPPKR